MARARMLRITGAVVVALVVGALHGCQGGLSSTDGVERGARAQLRSGLAEPGRDDRRAAAAVRDAPDRGDAADGGDALDHADALDRRASGEDGGAAATDDPAADASDGASASPAAATSDAASASGLPPPADEDTITALPVPPPPPRPGSEGQPGAAPAIDDVYPAKAPSSGGETITIRGRNLQPYLVLFGSMPATIVSASSDQGTVTLTVTAPPARVPGSPQVFVVVTNRDGRSAVASGKFQYFD